MNDKLIESLTNPVKLKLLTGIQMNGPTTAKQLAEDYSDIPHATLYRYLKRMTADGILTIVEEHQIRGTVEKVYAVAEDLAVNTQKMLEENNGPAYMMLFTQFMLGITNEFREYTARPDIDILQDCSGFTVAPVYASSEELTTALTEIGHIVQQLVKNTKTPERSLHNIAIITTPPKLNLEQREGTST